MCFVIPSVKFAKEKPRKIWLSAVTKWIYGYIFGGGTCRKRSQKIIQCLYISPARYTMRDHNACRRRGDCRFLGQLLPRLECNGKDEVSSYCYLPLRRPSQVSSYCCLPLRRSTLVSQRQKWIPDLIHYGRITDTGGCIGFIEDSVN